MDEIKVEIQKQIKKEKKSWVYPLIAIIIMVSVTIIFVTLASVLYIWNTTTASPEIYFYVKEPVITDVTIEIEDGVTKTIPEIPLGKKVTWESIYIDTDGIIHFNGKTYPFLYYEGRFEYEPSSYGWLVKKDNGQMYLNDEPTDKQELMGFLANQMEDSGLFQKEIDYLIDRMVQNDMLDFSSKYLIINYIPEENVDKVITLTTSHEFSIMRRHFLIQETSSPIELINPIYEEILDGDSIVHETAINRI